MASVMRGSSVPASSNQCRASAVAPSAEATSPRSRCRTGLPVCRGRACGQLRGFLRLVVLVRLDVAAGEGQFGDVLLDAFLGVVITTALSGLGGVAQQRRGPVEVLYGGEVVAEAALAATQEHLDVSQQPVHRVGKVH